MKKLLLAPALLTSLVSFGQAPRFTLDPSPAPATICYSRPESMHTKLPLPEAYLEQQRTGRRAAASAKIEVTYDGFSPEAQAAFQHAVDIWQSLLISPVTIRVQATWTPLAAGVLGSAGATAYYNDLSGATRNGVRYPVALAEKISGQDLNATNAPDINARFSSTFNWYYGLDGNVPAGQYDLVTVVLHELGHGLGFAAGTSYTAPNGSYGVPPSIFSSYIENQAGELLINNPAYPNNSAALGTQFTSNQLYFNSPLARAVNDDKRPRLYAPATYSSGSSISHLDEATYRAGDINSLMSPQVGAAEAMHNPGPLTLKMFDEMGWFNTAIRTTPLRDSEVARDFPVTATIISDGTVTPGSVKLNYAIDNAAPVAITMTNTGGNEYRGVIPSPGLNHKISYFITASDNETKRTYSAPAAYQPNVATVDRYSFVVGPDVVAPLVQHRAATYVFVDKLPLNLQVQATDNLGIGSVQAEVFVNGVAKPTLTLTRQGTSSTYTGGLTAAGIVAGDVLTYRILTRDVAAAANQTLNPTSGFYTVNVVGFKPAQAAYTNNFNSAAPLDFVGEGFTIAQPGNFANPAIHSDHQYANDTSLIYQMLVPIKVTSKNTIMTFDEVVLVEPGEPTATFGTEEFYDYVVVEGSTDQGATWKPVADGYDSRLQADWLAAWNLKVTAAGNSNSVGSPSLFKPHTFSLGAKYNVGDEVRLRFRLTADPGAFGWGWAIDNLVVSNVITSVASELKANGGLSVFPNPSAGQFRVQARFSRPTSGLEVVVRNMLGQEVFRQAVPATASLNLPIDLGQLASGLYQLSLGNGADATSRKILIQR
ncbi:T9SS type A sorting domain-containing protein [Hymenobacter psychrophilus]|uniref:Por secretion system C-terminal sorting domain-containing protein n=1 Tax=Hymenobacter psychrophilus TaxID=651662 RepID=A0A1H3EFK4_9BACT|nr:T9SS type A sorting domain-containing protein [Hymenobacter psychrophilus]SDX76694.1 Por secretion system C-terminal sorting domain-containing protein [Hymenobacter psychrophilus]